MSKKGNSKRSRERGTGVVEFALVVPIFVLLSVGAVDFGRALWLDHELDSIARDAVRYASVRSDDSDVPTSVSDMNRFIRSKTITMFDEHLDINTRWIPSNMPGNAVEVTLAYQYEPILALLPIQTSKLQGTARMIVSN
jgi:Flp pilus assembly protein TadG